MQQCPFCQSTNSDDAKACRACHVAFPWSKDLRRIERRVARLTSLHRRRTFAQHTQATKKSEASSIRRVRKVVGVILGSAAGTLLLGLQTYILHQQTTLIAKQTEALALDQTDHIRGHIVAASKVEESVRRLTTALEPFSNYQMDAEDAGPVIQAKNFAVNACQTEKCSKADVNSTLFSVSEDEPVVDPDVALGLVRYSRYLVEVENAESRVLEMPQELDSDKKSDNLTELSTLIAEGQTDCYLDPEVARDLSETMALLRLITTSAHAVIFRIADSATFREFTSKYPQTNTNTKMMVMQFQDAAGKIASLNKKDPSPTAPQHIKYTINDLVFSIANAQQTVIARLHDFDDQCKATLKHDAVALKSMSTAEAH
jgi:hypothetical protein